MCCSTPGVTTATVNLLQETADVQFDAARTAVDAIAEAIEDTGFEAKLQVAVSNDPAHTEL
jgi:copper chaperone CopZ